MSAKPESESKYKDTIFLPETAFPMRAGLPENEPKWVAAWAQMGLYQRLRDAARGRPLFVFHDGPPYANGNIHIGHALNKILKDFVVRSQQMMGKDAPNIPGWDCHGLPIEWKVEEEYRAKGVDKDTVPPAEFRARCRAYAKHWIAEQKREFIRLGCVGDWDNAYETMSFAAEAQIVREILKFKDNGLLYRGSKPVMWSIVEKTALAEAEVEYQEKKSPQIWVRFPVADGPARLKGTDIVIWTTTPWTIPANRAIAFSARIAYGLYEVTAVQDGALAVPGLRMILADKLAEDVAKGAKATLSRVQDAGPLAGIVCAHPLRGQGYDFPVPLLEGDHVTDDTGTGFVHTAPGHGLDDFWLWMSNPQVHPKDGPAVPHTVDADGSFYPHVPLFAGKRILTPEGKDGDANGAVIRELMTAGRLLAKGTFTHQYPHSWRSKAPLIFRNTPQWFLAMDKPFSAPGGEGTLRERALAEIKKVNWVPPQGENRLSAMVKDKPDWVLSRQRAWGVPIAVFVRKADGAVLDDKEVDRRIADIVEREGADAWYARPASDFLGNAYEPGDYEKVDDILDVWFESGATHAYVLEGQMGLEDVQADIYLEGSDQHRGWFQSSLIESVGTRGRAPYKTVSTHGFTLDEQGRKMSKSLGNTVEPAAVMKEYGADILRLWVASTNYNEDQNVGPKVLKAVAETYRKWRNTFRYVLASLDGWDERERLDAAQMPELERYMLHRLSGMDGAIRKAYREYDFNAVFNRINAFCVNDVSAFYVDMRKDALYCDAPASLRRRAVRTVLDHLFQCLTAWTAPILAFTMEEAWLARGAADAEASVHLRVFPEIPAAWRDDALADKWERLRELRRVVTGALELARAEKAIGSSLEAAPLLYISDPAERDLFAGVELSELVITSSGSVVVGQGPADAFRLPDVRGAAAVFAKAEGGRCDRCWRVLPEVGTIETAAELCRRCHAALDRAGRP
jgi:isoleucyl-tRNA synthetase